MTHGLCFNARRVLVTRPAPDAAQWVQRLQHGGLNAQSLPLIEIVGVSDPAAARAATQAWKNIGSYDACMFVSGNAVRFFFEQNKALRHALNGFVATKSIADVADIADAVSDTLPPTLRFMAPGPGTVAALRLAGVPAEQIDAAPPDAAQFDSEALWAVVGQRHWRGCRVLVVRGMTAQSNPDPSSARAASPGRDWITQQWHAAGCQVDDVHVYERRPPVWTPAQVQLARTASADGSVWLFSSSEAVRYLRVLVNAPGLSRVDWSGALAVATHPRIANAVLAAGWSVALQSRPAIADVLDCLRSIESTNS